MSDSDDHAKDEQVTSVPQGAAAEAVPVSLVSRPEEGAIPVYDRWLGSWRISLQRRPFDRGELTRCYDRAAPGWGRKLQRLGVSQAYEELLRDLLRQETLGDAALCSDQPLRVLDCGVGTGALSLALARVMTTPFQLDAIDISPAMLQMAERRFRNSAVAARLRHGDVHALPYESDQFDLVMIGHLLEHFADPGAALREALRVLKPGGLLIACLTRHSPQGLLVQLAWRTHRVTLAQAQQWLVTAGLAQVRSLGFRHPGFCRRASLAALGRKQLHRFETQET